MIFHTWLLKSKSRQSESRAPGSGSEISWQETGEFRPNAVGQWRSLMDGEDSRPDSLPLHGVASNLIIFLLVNIIVSSWSIFLKQQLHLHQSYSHDSCAEYLLQISTVLKDFQRGRISYPRHRLWKNPLPMLLVTAYLFQLVRTRGERAVKPRQFLFISNFAFPLQWSGNFLWAW